MWQDLLLRHLQSSKKPLIVVVGPTAGGKTAFSIEVAQWIQGVQQECVTLRWREAPSKCDTEHIMLRGACGAPQHDTWKAEIINADSRQLYRYLDIGTIKIVEGERSGIPHHLLSVLDPREEVTIAWYKEQASKVIDDILTRGGVPILVGGSMLYISSIIDGLKPLPPPHPEIRVRLSELYDRDGGVSLYQRLQKIDPESAQSIHPKNKVYLMRALEIYEGTGERASVQKRQHSCPWDVLIFGMQWPREELVRRINERTRQLFERGWVEEVQGLLEQGYTAYDPGMKSCGYREIMTKLQCPISKPKECFRTPLLEKIRGDEELIECIAAKTRQYAKRQMTWWKGDERIHWVDL